MTAIKDQWESPDGSVRLLLGDCLEILPTLEAGSIRAVVTDPPYPNGQGHFVDGIETARHICKTFPCDHWIVFWDDVEVPPVPLPLVSRHSWYRTNTNRPDNCEAIYEFHRDGKRRASKVFPFCVISPGLTGIEASGHPTEKHRGLMMALVNRSTGTVVDPYMGSGTTGVACIRTERRFIGIEIERKYFDIAVERCKRELERFPLFEKPKPKQLELMG